MLGRAPPGVSVAATPGIELTRFGVNILAYLAGKVGLPGDRVLPISKALGPGAGPDLGGEGGSVPCHREDTVARSGSTAGSGRLSVGKWLLPDDLFGGDPSMLP